MVNLFRKCLDATYIHTPDGGDYAVMTEGNTLYLLFEWSDGAEDWRSNFDFPATAYKNGTATWKCHRGFLARWKNMRDDIEKIVAHVLNCEPDITNITCIGYSHGAAIAVLATEDMEYLYGDYYVVSGYGFGCPRVLWGRIPQEVKHRLRNFRVIRNNGDIVTHVPPVVFGFRHAGNVVTVGKWGKYNPIDAHRPESYITELEGGGKEC